MNANSYVLFLLQLPCLNIFCTDCTYPFPWRKQERISLHADNIVHTTQGHDFPIPMEGATDVLSHPEVTINHS